jgi:glycosyltransferase involved in cell wall biosynthesis
VTQHTTLRSIQPPIPILHLIVELSVGGAQSALLRLLGSLDRKRFTPQVACFYNSNSLVAQQIRALGILVTDLHMPSNYRIDAIFRLHRLLCRERIVILHTWMFHANLTGRITGWLANVPIVITSRRNTNIGGNAREFINRWTSCLDQKVIAVSEAARQAEIFRAGVPAEKVITIYNGIDPAPYQITDHRVAARLRQSLGIPANSLLIGTVSRLHPQKGIDCLLSALLPVRERFPEVRLLLAGDGELRPVLQTRAVELGLAETVIFTGMRTDIPEFLAALDLFVLPSLWEGLPNVLLEAMAARKAIVATAVGGTTELIRHGENGLLVPPQDTAGLSDAILNLLSDHNKRSQMGNMGYRRVCRDFSLTKMVKSTEAVYNELLAQRFSNVFET